MISRRYIIYGSRWEEGEGELLRRPGGRKAWLLAGRGCGGTRIGQVVPGGKRFVLASHRKDIEQV